MKNFIIDLGVVPSELESMELHCDNNGAIAQSKEPRYHQKNKHVRRKYHIIRQFVNEGDIRMCKIHTDLNVADLLTKPLTLAKHEQHREAIGVKLLNVN